MMATCSTRRERCWPRDYRLMFPGVETSVRLSTLFIVRLSVLGRGARRDAWSVVSARLSRWLVNVVGNRVAGGMLRSLASAFRGCEGRSVARLTLACGRDQDKGV